MKNKLGQKINAYVLKLEQYADRPWYPFLITLLSALDQFIIIVPNDGILVASSILVPKRWPIFAFATTLGSSLGVLVIYIFSNAYGLPWILDFFPNLNQTEMWTLTENFFNQYGNIVIFAVGASPVVQQPVIILAALAHIPLGKVMIIYIAGRLLKYIFLGYVASHSPKLLKKLWGIRGDMKDAGVKLD